MAKNPRKRTTKSQKVEEKELSSEAESSENSISDERKSPENEATDYEEQRKSRIAQNNAKLEAMGLHKIANSLMELGGNRKSKRAVKSTKEDEEYEPNDDDGVKDDSSDSDLSSSSEEFGKKKKKQKKENAKGSTSGSQKEEPPPRVFIPDSSLHSVGDCEEKVLVTFPKVPDEEVKDLMDRFPKGFNGFNCKQGERCLRRIAHLKAECWRLRRSYMWYPEFREEKVEGLPFPEGFDGFNLEESKEMCGVLLTLENAHSRLKTRLQLNVHQGANGLQRPEASGSYPMETSHTPHALYHQHQQAASTFVPNPVQPNAPMFPGYMQFPPYWSPHMVPYGMVPIPWNPYNANYPPPPASYHSGMTKF